MGGAPERPLQADPALHPLPGPQALRPGVCPRELRSSARGRCATAARQIPGAQRGRGRRTGRCRTSRAGAREKPRSAPRRPRSGEPSGGPESGPRGKVARGAEAGPAEEAGGLHPGPWRRGAGREGLQGRVPGRSRDKGARRGGQVYTGVSPGQSGARGRGVDTEGAGAGARHGGCRRLSRRGAAPARSCSSVAPWRRGRGAVERPPDARGHPRRGGAGLCRTPPAAPSQDPRPPQAGGRPGGDAHGPWPLGALPRRSGRLRPEPASCLRPVCPRRVCGSPGGRKGGRAEASTSPRGVTRAPPALAPLGRWTHPARARRRRDVASAGSWGPFPRRFSPPLTPTPAHAPGTHQPAFPAPRGADLTGEGVPAPSAVNSANSGAVRAAGGASHTRAGRADPRRGRGWRARGGGGSRVGSL